MLQKGELKPVITHVPLEDYGKAFTDLAERRVIEVKIGDQTRIAAAEDTARFRDAVGIVAPLGLPDAFIEGVKDSPTKADQRGVSNLVVGLILASTVRLEGTIQAIRSLKHVGE